METAAPPILQLRKRCFGHFSPEDNSISYYSWLNQNPHGCSRIIAEDDDGNLMGHMGFAGAETKICGNSQKVVTIFDAMVQRPLRKKGLYRIMLGYVLQNIGLQTPIVTFPMHPVRLNTGKRISVVSHKLRAFLPSSVPKKLSAEEISSQESFECLCGDPRNVDFLKWRYGMNDKRVYKFFKVSHPSEGEGVIVLRRVRYRGVPIWLLVDGIHGRSEILPPFLVAALATAMKTVRSVILMPMYTGSRCPGTFEIPVPFRRSVAVVHAPKPFQDMVRSACYLVGSKLSY